MHSMSEALKTALEHPMEEPPHRPKTTWKPKASRSATTSPMYFWWGLLGSTAATLLFLHGRKRRAEERARLSAQEVFDFGAD